MDQRRNQSEINGQVHIASSFSGLGFHLCFFMQIMMDKLRNDEWNWKFWWRRLRFHARFKAREFVWTVKKLRDE